MKKILVTAPGLNEEGGVASYFNAVQSFLPTGTMHFLQIGSRSDSLRLCQPILDQLRFRHTLKMENPTLVHVNPSLGNRSFIRDGLFVLWAKKAGYPCLVFWHGWNKKFEARVDNRFLGFFRKTFGQADAFIVLASEFERKLREWGVVAPIYRETTTYDKNLLHDFDVTAKWSEFKTSDTIRILFLARLEKSKGIFETVQAVRLLLDKGLPVSLTIAGDGTARQDIEKFVQSLSFSFGQVEFVGFVRGQKKIEICTRHHIYCLPSHSEGVPISLLEAMAFGMPVLTRPVGGLVDIFEDGKMGVFVKSNRPEEIAYCLEKLIVKRDKLVSIGKYNADYARNNFTPSVVAKRLQDIYGKTIIN